MLQVSLESDGSMMQVSPWGASTAFNNDYFEGSLFFVHRPPTGSDLSFEFADLLAGRGSPTPLWEMQIQGRFKVKPCSTVFFGLELWNGPMRLGVVTRSLCRIILKFGSFLAKQRGIEFRHSFGKTNGEKPRIAFPILGADRIFLSDSPIPLPLAGNSDKGVWRMQDGSWAEVDRSSVAIDEGTFATFLFATSRIDWSTWTLAGIPGLGSLNLADFWGPQAAHFVIYDEIRGHQRLFFNMEIALAKGMLPKPQENDRGAQQHVRWAAWASHKQPVGFNAEECFQEEPTIADICDCDLESIQSNFTYCDDEGSPANPVIDKEDVSAGPGKPELSRSSSIFKGLVLSLASCQVNICSRRDRQLQGDSAHLVAAADQDQVQGVPAHPELEHDAADKLDDADYTVLDLHYLMQHEHMLHAESDEPSKAAIMADGDVASKHVEAEIAETQMQEIGRSPEIPWYFVSRSGAVWWCISFGGKLRWLHHDQLKVVCSTHLGMHSSLLGAASAIGLEAIRRLVCKALAQMRHIPASLLECSPEDVDLRRLLKNGESQSPSWEYLGVVQAEGCIVQRGVTVEAWLSQLWCENNSVRHPIQDHVAGRAVGVDLRSSKIEHVEVAGAPAFSVTGAHREFLIVMADSSASSRWTRKLSQAIQLNAGTPLNCTSLRGFAGQIVVNDRYLCFASPGDPVTLSAELLREAIAAQQGSSSDLRALTLNSAALKSVCLAGLTSQEIWSFWINIFHCLLIHAQLACGRPRGMSQVVRFYTNCAYIVAGHVLTLSEIEHWVLRRQMSKPHLRAARLLLWKVRQRTNEIFEQCPEVSAPWSPGSAFSCLPDWRLNLVLSAGNESSSDTIPIFERCSRRAFEELIHRTMDHTLSLLGRFSSGTIELPYILRRYHEDAPRSAQTEKSELRWARALQLDLTARITYARHYNWKMLPSLKAMPCGSLSDDLVRQGKVCDFGGQSECPPDTLMAA